MNIWVALLKREWWEHRGGLGWAPLATLALIVVFLMVLTTVGGVVYYEPGVTTGDDMRVVVLSGNANLREWVQLVLSEHDWTKAFLTQQLANVGNGITAVFALVYFSVAVFVLLGCLHDDRKDGTVLFWKSLPVTDTQTVVSKLVMVVWLAPVVVIACIAMAQLFALGLLSFLVSGSEQLSVAELWASADPGNDLVMLVVQFYTQAFWSFPLWGWLLLVSAVVPKIAMVWAIFLPSIPVFLEVATFGTDRIRETITLHFFDRVFTMGTVTDEERSGATELVDIARLWLTTDMWLGIAVGVAFVFAAVYFRRRKNEI